jgi:hypothetical protein
MEAEKKEKKDLNRLKNVHEPNWYAGDYIIGGLFIIFAILMFIGAYNFQWRPRMGIMTSANFTPMLLSVLVVLLTVLMMILTRRRFGKVNFRVWMKGVLADEKMQRSFILIGMIAAYIFLVGLIHFVIVNILFFFAMFWYLKIGTLVRTIIYAVLSGLFVGMVVPYVFQMPLP